MRVILAGFFEILGLRPRPGTLDNYPYESFMSIVEFNALAADEWMRYAHDLFPIAPPGFHWIGRHANAPRQLLGLDLARIRIPNPFPELELDE